MRAPTSIYTIGHSSLELDAFLARLAARGVTTLVDVRAHPGSRRHPHFARDALAESLPARGVRYEWMGALGGRRPRSPGPSRHGAWDVESFRNYADYADGPEFACALGELTALATAAPTAFMCAETLWWQCHRRLIADHLVVAGWTVLHIMRDRDPAAHRLPDFARISDGKPVYDVGATPSLL